MAVRLFNTLTRRVEDLVPRDPAGRRVCMYCCGPTVHDYAHVGNFRTFVFADVARRYLEFRGYAVDHAMNITDVEDKIIGRVREAGVPLTDYTRRFEGAFLEDLKALGCLLPHHMPRATAHTDEMIALIGALLEKGVAYRAQDGSVYFSIDRYRAGGRTYGQLVTLDFDEMRVGERVAADEYAKESVADFALWKARVPEDGAVFWESPWGQGRPGWHIECSAMSMKLFGPSFDLHLGGEDLAFPHHEDEIAQSEGAGLQAPGERFVTHWLHVAHLLVEGRKMSKSLGNYFTLRDLVAKGFSGREVRFLLASSHYRESFNFTLEGLSGARSALARIDECVLRLRERAGGCPVGGEDRALLASFTDAMDDDLNVSRAWGVVFDWVRERNRHLGDGSLDPAEAAGNVAAWERVDAVFGTGAGAPTTVEVPEAVTALMAARVAARTAKDWKRADAIRDELKRLGWVIEDTPSGPRAKRC